MNSGSVLPWEDGLVIEPTEPDLPGISIVIPIFNSGKFLEKTLRSLLCNDLTGIELILMDGGSTDDTSQIIDHYRDMFTVVVSKKDKGQSDAINKGYAQATHPILHWLNGDDILLPNILVAVRQAFRDNVGADVIVGDAYMTEVDFTPIDHFRFSREALTFQHLLDYAHHHLVQPSVFFTRKAWDVAGPVKLWMHYAMDADLFLNMASRFTFLHLPMDIAYSVYHDECKTRDNRGDSIAELALVQALHGGFDEARKTLGLLVDLLKDAERRADIAPLEDVTRQQLATLENTVAKNRDMLLDLDMEHS